MAKLTQRGREMQRLLMQWERSGLTLASFARWHGRSVHTLRRWKQRLSRVDPEGAPKFVEVNVSAPHAVTFFEVVLPGGTVVRVGERFDPQALGELLNVVRGAC